MTIDTDWEEKQKDEILQKINDELEHLDWGGSCKKLVMKIVFDGKFNIRPIRSFKGFKTEEVEI